MQKARYRFKIISNRRVECSATNLNGPRQGILMDASYFDKLLIQVESILNVNFFATRCRDLQNPVNEIMRVNSICRQDGLQKDGKGVDTTFSASKFDL